MISKIQETGDQGDLEPRLRSAGFFLADFFPLSAINELSGFFCNLHNHALFFVFSRVHATLLVTISVGLIFTVAYESLAVL